MPLLNKDIQQIEISHAKKQAWTAFINAGGIETATVLYWIGQLPTQEKAQLKQAMKKYACQSIEQGEIE